MFKNRMFIVQWSHNMHNTPLIFRTSEHSCQCSVCEASRSSEADSSGESTSRLPREKQPLPELVLTQSSTGDVPTGSLPVPGEETPLSSTEISGGNNKRYSSSPGRQSVERSDSPRPSCSSSTTASDSIRSNREHRSSHTRTGISHTFTGSLECLESPLSGGDDGHDSPGARMGDISSTDSTPSDDDLSRPRKKLRASQEVVVLGETQNQETWDQVSTTVTDMGGNMGTITIPTRIQWFTYLSYLQSRYG